MPPLLAHSITAVPASVAGHPLICGSHGGLYAAHCALVAGVSAVVFNDAGRGKDDAGIAGLAWLDGFGVPAAAVSHTSARIGDAHDSWQRGVVSTVNRTAQALGGRVGQRVEALWTLLLAAPPRRHDAPPLHESRAAFPPIAAMPVVVLDSISLVQASDREAAVIAASHGGLLGGDPQAAIKHDVFALVCHDAGVGIDDAGVGRLAPLDARGIAAVTVGAESARIGDGRSVLEDGVISHANSCARRGGGRIGQTTQEFLRTLASHHPRNTP